MYLYRYTISAPRNVHNTYLRKKYKRKHLIQYFCSCKTVTVCYNLEICFEDLYLQEYMLPSILQKKGSYYAILYHLWGISISPARLL